MAAGSSEKTRERVEVAKRRSTPRLAWIAFGGLGLAIAGISVSRIDFDRSEQHGSLAASSDPVTLLATEDPEDSSISSEPSPPAVPSVDTVPLVDAPPPATKAVPSVDTAPLVDAPAPASKVDAPAAPSTSPPEQARERPIDEADRVASPAVKPKPKAKTKTKVRLTSTYKYVEVRIDGKGPGVVLVSRHTPILDIELTPGVHDFEILEEDVWTPAGRLKIPGGVATVVIEDGRVRLK